MKHWKKRWKAGCLALAAALLFGGIQYCTVSAASGSDTVTQSVKKAGRAATSTQNREEDVQTYTDSGVTSPTSPTPPNAPRVNVNGKEYQDMASAWEAAVGQGEATVRLLGPVTTDTPCVLTDGNITLDLNGCKWSYGHASSRSVRDQSDLIQVRGGNLTIRDDSNPDDFDVGSMQYKVNSEASGACVYADGGTVTILGGSFVSTASASIVIEDRAVLNVEGGTFQNTKSGGSAITINDSVLNMSGGRVTGGSLTLYKGGKKVKLGEGSEFTEIRLTETEDGKITDVLTDDCAFRRISSSGNEGWITDENVLSGMNIRNVQVARKPLRSMTLTVTPDDQKEIPFSYTEGTEFTMTVEAVAMDSGSEMKYEWYRTCNGGERQPVGNGSRTYSFSTAGLDAGEYVYHVGATADGYEEWKTYTVKITPLEPGIITNNGYQTEYTYGDFAAPAINGGSGFAVSETPEGADLEWTYTWYQGDKEDNKKVEAPSDVGVYTLEVEAADEPNYKAVGEVQVTIIPREVTPRIEGTTTKVYDGTTKVEDARVELDNVVPGDSNGVGVKAASFAYNDANVSSANRIIASGIELTGNKAGNYKLSSTEASVEAGITKARLILQMSITPNTQKINRPVTVTVTALNSDDSSPMDNSGLRVEDIRLTVSGRNDTEEAHILPLTASGSQYGVYAAEYTTAIKGDKTFTAEIAGNANYEVSNIASDNTLTILEKTEAVMNLTASETENLVYGDEVTYTAVVSKANEDDTDALNGTVQFYEEEVADNHKIGSARNIVMSGDKASITLDRSDLTAGDHKILAVFSGSENFEDINAEISTSVAKKQLTWDVSGLSASKAAGIAGEVTVYGELKLDGLLDEGDVTFERPSTLTTNGLKSTEAGSYKVTVVSESKGWKFDPEEPENYELPEGDPEITAKVNAVKELPNPPADTEDGKKFKLVMEEGISTVPEGLLNTSFNTPIKIEQELKRVLTESGVFKEENTAVYDVVLQVSTDEGTTWEVADYTNFPSDGLLVTLPYPGGTGRYTNNFAVAHMFATSYFGKTSGQVEIPAVRKTDNGMEFTVTGLSPIGLAWSGPMDAANQAGGGASRMVSGAATWDDNPILLYACLAGGATLAIVSVIIVCAVRSKKKKKKNRR